MTALAHEAHRPALTHAQVTRDVVKTLETPGRGYYLALFGAVAMFLVGLFTFVMLLKEGLGLAGYTPPVMWSVYITGGPGPRRLHPAGDVERLHHHLRLLDRHRTRRHAHFGDPVSLPLPLAHRGVPLHRGDDGLRGHDGGALSDHPHRAPVDLLLAPALSQPAVPPAQPQIPAPLGRVRDHHLFHGLG